jgi:hypothetical protein
MGSEAGFAGQLARPFEYERWSSTGQLPHNNAPFTLSVYDGPVSVSPAHISVAVLRSHAVRNPNTSPTCRQRLSCRVGALRARLPVQ